MEKFRKKWQRRFSEKNAVPPHVDHYRDPVDIAEHFKQVFTSCNFDSDADNQSATELKEKLSKMDKWESSKTIFHVMDIKHFHVLKMGRRLE